MFKEEDISQRDVKAFEDLGYKIKEKAKNIYRQKDLTNLAGVEDLKIKGLAQFIFREFCKELASLNT